METAETLIVICEDCSERVPKDWRYCINCGAKLTGKNQLTSNLVSCSWTAFSFAFVREEKGSGASGLVNALHNICSQNPHFLGILFMASDWC